MKNNVLLRIFQITFLSIFIGAPFAGLPCPDFIHNLWGPSFKLLSGQSPYIIDDIFPDCKSVWFPMVIGIFFPLGYLSKNIASSLWLAMSSICILGILKFCQSDLWNLRKYCSVVWVILLAPTTIMHIYLGQFTFLGCALILASCQIIFAKTDRNFYSDAASAAAIALVLTKPQLCFLAMPCIAYGYWKKNGLWNVMRWIFAVFFFCIIFSVPLQLLYKSWFFDFIQAQLDNPAWFHPSSYLFWVRGFGNPGLFVWLLQACVVLYFNFLIWKNLPEKEAILWTLGLTTIISVYVWSWDFILFYPLLITGYQAFVCSTKKAIFLAFLLIGMIRIYFFWFSGNMLDQFNWWVPYYLLFLAIFAHAEKIKIVWKNHRANIQPISRT